MIRAIWARRPLLPIRSFGPILAAVLSVAIFPPASILAQDPSPKPESPGAQEEKKKGETTPSEFPLITILGDPDWSFHYQATAVEQARGRIHSPYQSNLSLQEQAEHAMSYTTTIFLARRLWEDAWVAFDPEIAGGSGLSSASGVAGFPNGEITRVNRPAPTPYFARLYFQQTINFGERSEKVEPDLNQLSEMRSPSRLEFRLGKMALGDVFDMNPYAHDPRTQFLNWALFENGAWDYPADTRGYTYGTTFELTEYSWSLRYGIWMEPKFANGLPLDRSIAVNHGQALEGEYRWAIDGHPGTVRLLGYLNNAKMGSYRQTIDDPALGMDVTQTRKNGRAKYGLCLSADQELTQDIGVFLRAGADDGRTESFAFTQIDRTLTPGVSVKGIRWSRPDDRFGIAYVLNGLSGDQRAYLARGGQGFIIGDGQLHYGFEQILETYYALKIFEKVFLSVDYQYVKNPAYNADRGPASIIALRLHVEF